jgi:MFS transporter
MPTVTEATEAAEQWSYWRVLRSGRLGALLVGNLISSVGNGMILSALPLLTLEIRGRITAGLAIAAAQASPYVLSCALALTLGLTRLRIPPRAAVLADSWLRAATFAVLGVLAVTGTLTFWMLVAGLLVGSVFQVAATSGRRLLATGMTEPAGLFAVNGLLGTSNSLAAYVIGPVAGGVISVAASPGVALIADGITFLVMLAAVYFAAPVRVRPARQRTGSASGWRILRGKPAAARLFAVVFCFNLFYMPVEVALPLLVRGPWHGNGAALGLIWAGFGAGAVIGAVATALLRNAPRQPVLIAIIAGWAVVTFLLALCPSVVFAAAVFFLGGLIYSPFTPIAYTFVQSLLTPDEQQPVITLWSAGALLAGPLGLALGGPLVSGAGERGGLIVSALLTVALVPLASFGLHQAALGEAAAATARR